MTAKSSPVTTISIGLSGITVLPDRMRRLRPEAVAKLVEAIREDGQLLHPIVVRTKPHGGLGYILVAGWHRLMAARALKWDSIRATVLDGISTDQATLAEIDENLIRTDLTPAERAIHMARRKELYEKLHPQTKAKIAGGKARQGTASDKLSFAKETAKAIGKNKRTIERDAKRGKDIPTDVLSGVVGTSLDKGDELDALGKLSPDDQRELIEQARKGGKKKVSAKTRVKQVKREQREQELGAKQLAMPAKKYGLVVSDDEWDFKVYSRETGMDRHAANHYPTATGAHTAEKMHEHTKDRFKCAAKDCVLAMWTTVPYDAIAHELLRLRGFTYKSQVMWRKTRTGKGRGSGYWFINEHEVMLIGTRGKIPAPAPGTQWSSVIEAPVGEHSAKPEIFLQMLEEYFPNLPKIELNRRGKPRPGWDAWGNEAALAS